MGPSRAKSYRAPCGGCPRHRTPQRRRRVPRRRSPGDLQVVLVDQLAGQLFRHQRCAAGTPAFRLEVKPRSLLSACRPGNVSAGRGVGMQLARRGGSLRSGDPAHDAKCGCLTRSQLDSRHARSPGAAGCRRRLENCRVNFRTVLTAGLAGYDSANRAPLCIKPTLWPLRAGETRLEEAGSLLPGSERDDRDG